MAINPIAAASLLAAGGAALTSIPTLIPNANDRANKKRLALLEKRAAANQLGLSPDEIAVLDEQLSARSEQSQAVTDAKRNALLAGGGVTGGTALQAAVGADAARSEVEADNSARIAEANLLQKQAQQEEIAALRAATAERTGQKVAAVTGIARDAVEAGVTTSAQQQYMQGAMKTDETVVKMLSQKHGISEDEARGLYEAVNRNPDIGTLFNAMRGSQSRR